MNNSSERYVASQAERDLTQLLYALKDRQELPSPRVLHLLGTAGRWPEDWEAGKRMQRDAGLDAIPPVTECELGAGFWKRVILADRRTEKQP